MQEELKITEYSQDTVKKADLEGLYKEIQTLQEIHQDFSSILHEQENDLKATELLQDKTIEETENAVKVFKEAAILQSKSWKMKIGAGFAAIGASLGVIAGPIGVVFGGTFGGLTGRTLGKKIEKIQRKEIEEIQP